MLPPASDPARVRSGERAGAAKEATGTDSMPRSILLVFPKLWEKEFKRPSDPPYGLLMVADRLVKEGYRITVYDERLESTGRASKRDLWRAFDDPDLLCAGFSVQTGPPIENGIRIAREMKRRRPSIPIVWGGIHPSLLPEQTARHPVVDVAVVGEGEETFQDLVHALEAGRDLAGIPGILFKRDGAVVQNPRRDPPRDLDGIGIAWDLVPVRDYIQVQDGRRTLGLITSRGCPFRCNFCYILSFYGQRSWRIWSLERTLAEVRRLLSWGVEFIRFEDDNLVSNRRHLKNLCDAIRGEGLRFHWWASVRAEAVKEETARMMREAGCRYIGIGAESGSDGLLKRMKKDNTRADILAAAAVLERAGIKGKFNWIVGFPGETEEDIRATLETVDEIERSNPSSAHLFNVFAPYPGTESYEMAKELGFSEPPELEGWFDNFREQCSRLAYVRDKEYVETVRWVGVMRAMRKKIGFYASWAKPAIYLLSAMAQVRWRRRYFRRPYEYRLLNAARRTLRRLDAFQAGRLAAKPHPLMVPGMQA